MDEVKIKDVVKKRYAAAARKAESCCDTSSCCSDEGGDSRLVDYGLISADLPVGADLGLGCGLPTQFADLKMGEIVLDLGSGAGVDVFLAAKQVGAEGRAIGVDMTPEMIAKAWENAVKGGYRNVDFRLGEIESLPVEDESIDVVLSNCVINLVPDKKLAFEEIYRVLKPGGRFSISDMVTYGEVSNEIREDMAMWAGCVAGALDKDVYLQTIRESGFVDVRVNQLVEYDYMKHQDYGIASLTVEGRKL